MYTISENHIPRGVEITKRVQMLGNFSNESNLKIPSLYFHHLILLLANSCCRTRTTSIQFSTPGLFKIFYHHVDLFFPGILFFSGISGPLLSYIPGLGSSSPQYATLDPPPVVNITRSYILRLW